MMSNCPDIKNKSYLSLSKLFHPAWGHMGKNPGDRASVQGREIVKGILERLHLSPGFACVWVRFLLGHKV